MGAPDYDFKDLSPYDFESLARDLLTQLTGTPFSTYAMGKDGGIDLRAWDQYGVHVAQCKHTPDAQRGKLMSYARQESEKIRKSKRKISSYLFLTTADISVQLEDDIRQVLSGVADTVEVRGRGWINGLIGDHPTIERRHFKLWLKSSMAISEMLRGGVFLRGYSRVNRIKRNYMKFVHHDGCVKAEHALEETGIAIVSGAPGSGKTAIAEYLILQWWRRGYRVIVDPRTVDSWWDWLEDETPTVFFFDDAWGQTKIHDGASGHRDEDFAEFLSSVLEKRLSRETGKIHDKVVVVTSRSLILHDLLRTSDATSHLFEGLASSLVQVEKLAPEVRAKILFNHVNASVSDQRIRMELATGNWWREISSHSNYSPRIVDLVTTRGGYGSGRDLIEALHGALANPKDIWEKSFAALRADEQLLVSVLAVSNSRGSGSIELVQRIASQDATSIGNALSRLSGTWVDRVIDFTGDTLELTDPSQRDFLIHRLARDPIALLDVIRNTASMDDLALICERGRPPELEYQQSLFSFDEESSLRASLDFCAISLQESLRSAFAVRLGAATRSGSEDSFAQELAEMLQCLARVLMYQTDRYQAPGVSALDTENWFEECMGAVFPLLDNMKFVDVEGVVGFISDVIGTLMSLTENRVVPKPYDSMIVGLRLAITQMWEEWDVQAQEKAGVQAYVNDIHEALIRDSILFHEVGLTRTAEEVVDVKWIEEELVSRIQEGGFDVGEWDVWRLERVLECRLSVARAALAKMEEEVRSQWAVRRISLKRVSGQPNSNNLETPVRPFDEIDVLFRSLAITGEPE
ncbi:hypothetical protein AB0M58_38005 [Streptomyces bobili]|uniref:nSTAND3 domain-containing NTPase n=1 Tax=Streptomyces bobili TaxID=67280 RepID=UPI0034306A1D